ncbi:MAG: hypothetical protein JXP73_04770 [Deltaproteobacteria bacterium]|nr:hypothetical protein [Deltaproteobacteria bacterium]
MKPSWIGFLAFALSLVPAAPRAEPVTVPVDIGVGPAAYVITGPVFDDQPAHAGLKISIQAIIDQATIRAHQNRIPARYRQQAMRMREVRYSPSIFIPDALIISPKIHNTGIYGVTWRPISIGLPLIDAAPVRLGLSAGLLVTYAFLYSDVAELPTTHFIRPGLDIGAELEVALTQSLLISLGWASGLYVPQGLGTFGMGPLGDEPSWDALRQTLWHFGQGFLKLHFRFPYTVNL